MFHAKSGLYFERLPGGSVKVTLRRKQPGLSVGGALIDGSPIEVVLDSQTWASAVASVTKQGNLVSVSRQVLWLHEQGVPWVPVS